MLGNSEEEELYFKYSILSGSIPINLSYNKYLIDTKFYNIFNIWNRELCENVKKITFNKSIINFKNF